MDKIIKKSCALILGILLLALGILVPGEVQAQHKTPSESDISAEESRILEEDRQALEDAIASGRSTKIMTARKQLSDDMDRFGKRRRMDLDGIVIPLTSDDQGHYFVDVVINNHIPASLMVDTGAPVVMLSAGFVRKLGLDTRRIPKGYLMTLNGKHPAAQVSLRSVKVGRAERHDVFAAVMLEGDPELDGKFQDGLLGLSFLKGYHYTIDHKKKRLILQKVD